MAAGGYADPQAVLNEKITVGYAERGYGVAGYVDSERTR